MPPKILIPQPTSADLEYNRQCWPSYAQAIRAAGGEPVELALGTSQQALQLELQDISGILLPGSPADVDPARYGHPWNPETAPADSAREAVDWFLLESAERLGIPLLAICFGLQSLNVFRGGTLVQHLPGVPVNHSAGASVAVAHSVVPEPDSFLASLASAEKLTAGPALRLPVNSSHHQCVEIPGEGLRIVARSSEDGVIEALQPATPGPFLLGLQWHPERTVDRSATSRAIFAAFVDAASGYGARKIS